MRWDGATVALLALLAGTAYLRFTHLGYAELHGDETLVALRAVDVIQGYERALFVHKKGPAEILIGVAVYLLTGHLTEFTAHLPFALASFAGVGAVYALARRWFGPVAGWWAAAMVAVDGYLMAFGRMLQYQSVVFLMVVLTALLMQEAVAHPRRAGRSLLLAALVAATGLLAHYEGALAAVPALWLLICLWRANDTPSRVLRQLAGPVALGTDAAARVLCAVCARPGILCRYVCLCLWASAGRGRGAGGPVDHRRAHDAVWEQLLFLDAGCADAGRAGDGLSPVLVALGGDRVGAAARAS